MGLRFFQRRRGSKRAEPIPVDPPLAPSGVGYSSINGFGFTVTWTDNSNNESSFQVEVASDAGFSTIVQTTTVGKNSTNAVITGLSPLTSYWARVRARNIIGDSAWATGAEQVTTDAPPVAPSDVFYDDVAYDSLTVNWTVNSLNETGLFVELATDADFTNVVDTATKDSGKTSHNFLGLNPSTSYWGRVRAFNAGGNSAWATGAEQVTPSGIPDAPTSPSYSGIDTEQFVFEWVDNSSDEINFTVQVATDADFTNIILDENEPAETTFKLVTGLTPVTDYYARVRANGPVGSSAWATGSVVTTASAAPNAPTGVFANAVSTTGFTINWTDNSTNETDFQVQVATDSGFTSIVQSYTPTAGTTSQVVTGLTVYTLYYYRVRARNGLVPSAWAEGTAQRTAFDMTYFGSDLVYLFDAKTGADITVDGSNRVTSWTNRGSGSPAAAIQTSAVLRPLYVAGTDGGVDFTGARVLEVAQDLSSISYRTLISVITPTANTSVVREFVSGGTGATRRHFQAYTSSRRRNLQYRDNAGALYTLLGTNLEMNLNGTYAISMRVRQNGNDLIGESTINGAGLATQTGLNRTAQPMTGATTWRIGSQDSTGLNSFSGLVKFTCLIKRAITDAESSLVSAYIAGRFTLG